MMNDGLREPFGFIMSTLTFVPKVQGNCGLMIAEKIRFNSSIITH
jgi:hypothetical protein